MSETDQSKPVHPLEEAHGEFEMSPLARSYADKLAGNHRGRKVSGGKENKQAFVPEVVDEILMSDLSDRGHSSLHNAPVPELRIRQEKSEHRFLVYLFAQGLNLKEVFLSLGGKWDETTKQPVPGTGRYTYAWLSQIKRQPWFQRQLIMTLEEQGRDIVTAKLEATFSDSLDTVILMRDTADSDSVRLNAANSLIDRFIGKPTQHIKTEQAKDSELYEAEYDQLQRELKQVEAEMKSL